MYMYRITLAKVLYENWYSCATAMNNLITENSKCSGQSEIDYPAQQSKSTDAG